MGRLPTTSAPTWGLTARASWRSTASQVPDQGASMLRFSGAGVSDVGRVRDHNEDSAFVSPYLALVMLDAVAAARRNLAVGVCEDEARGGMATTLSALLCDGERVLLGHVGDSRAYLLHDGVLRQVSRDHTYVQQMRDTGQLTGDSAAQHPWRNVVLRSVDGNPAVDPHDIDLVELDVREGDRLLLCSDGLSDLVDDARITEVLGLVDPHSAAAVLTQSALAAGGRDNVTCLVLDVVEGPQVVGDGRLLGAVQDAANIVDPAAVHLARADTA